jgi:hypothetical protein
MRPLDARLATGIGLSLFVVLWNVAQVNGPGVIGLYPLLQRGEPDFAYCSCTHQVRRWARELPLSAACHVTVALRIKRVCAALP